MIYTPRLKITPQPLDHHKTLLYLFWFTKLSFNKFNLNSFNFTCWSNFIHLLGLRPLKKINKFPSYHHAVNYRYQSQFLTNKIVFRRFLQSKLLNKFFLRLKKKIKFFKFNKKKLFQNINSYLVKPALTSTQSVNFLKFFLYKNLTPIMPKFSNFTLRRKIFLTTPNITRVVADFVYTSAKTISTHRHQMSRVHTPQIWRNNVLSKHKTNHKAIFYNAHKSLIWKMRAARFAHWWTQTRGTLNEWRYDKLLSRELSTYLNYFQKQLLCVVLTSVYCCFLSWKQQTWFFFNNLSLVNGKMFHINIILKFGDIIEFPFGPGLKLFSKFNHQRFLRKLYSAKKFLYKTTLKPKSKNLKNAHRCPRLIQRLPAGLQTLGRLLAVDPGLKTICIVHQLPYLTHSVLGNVLISAVLTLQNWRFRFD